MKATCFRTRAWHAIFFVVLCLGAHAAESADPLGATPHADGTVFRVWAPFVDHVSVKVNNGTPVPLAREPGHADPADAVWTGKATAKAGDTYCYVIQCGAETKEYLDPRCLQIATTPAGKTSVIVDLGPPPPPLQTFNPKEWVLYELHVGTFSGTFTAAIGKLDYLKNLGINAVEVLPLHENPELKGHIPPEHDWGYDPVQLFAVESSYGTPADFKNFVAACHSRKIAVIVDVVYNHTYGASVLNQFGGWSQPSVPRGIYYFGGPNAGTGFGPRPDYGRPQVRAYIEDQALSMLRDFGADGLRWDSTINIRENNKKTIPEGLLLMRQFNLDRLPLSNKLLIAEDLNGWAEVVKPAPEGLGFDAQWDDQLCWALRQAVGESDDAKRDVNAVKAALEKNFGGSVFQRVLYSENHDQVGHPESGKRGKDFPLTRLPAVIDPQNPESGNAKRRSLLAAAIVLTAPCIPMLFQGQETLESQPFTFGKAAPVDWKRVERFPGIVQAYRELIALRRNIDKKTAGLMGEHFAVLRAGPVLAYRRWDKGGPTDDVLVAANFTHERQTVKIGLPRAGAWKVRFNSTAKEYDPEFSAAPSPDTAATAQPLDGLPYSGTVTLIPYSLLILSQD